MVDNVPPDVQRAFERHDAIETTEDGFEVTTTAFDSTVTVEQVDGSIEYRVSVRVPTLDAATKDEVGPTVALDWFETFERRLEDAAKAVRERVELTDFTVEETERVVTVEYAFSWENPTRAVEIVKAFVEYVEGTYVEGVIPGYEYRPPVTELLGEATQGGEGGTPL